ncbi:E3 ubiquitin-protein ligase TRIM35 [Syngnathus scovelli]|uniref:E3 ubiquitin-protein ligase TRIM35 n=1 Tax=Syngnathus scovelli TaxID=161590 RepID=UPI0021106DF2|nr:E3 ubiquitin-protein ligase TRIM35 [Syngnathus scovelli]
METPIPLSNVSETPIDPSNVSETPIDLRNVLEDICSLHKKKYTHYCLNDMDFVCRSCKDEQIHAGHEFDTIITAKKRFKDKLCADLQDAKTKLEDYEKIKKDCNDQEKYIKIQREQVETKIKKDFKEFRDFLKVQEEARLSAVKEEEKKKIRMIRNKLKDLQKDIFTLSAEIKSKEKQLKCTARFLKNCKSQKNNKLKLPDKPMQLKGAMLDEAKHVGNLKFNVWEQMNKMVSYSPVILDANTARDELDLSEDLTSVRFGKKQELPNNPERFKRCNVLGIPFVPGKHMWDVEVKDNTDWEVGVAWGDPSLPNDMIIQSIAFCNGEYKMFDEKCHNPPVQRIRIHVEAKKKSISISFSECSPLKELCKTTCQSLGGNISMFPFFRTRDRKPLKIIPIVRCVKTQSQ